MATVMIALADKPRPGEFAAMPFRKNISMAADEQELQFLEQLCKKLNKGSGSKTEIHFMVVA